MISYVFISLWKCLMARIQHLKIYIQATQAKPGGNIGAMLSPYLFSNNLSDFCKRFNEQSKDYLTDIWLPVIVCSDVIEKVYTFKVKYASAAMFFLNFFENSKKISVLNLYDLVKYFSVIYKISLYKMSVLIFSILKSFRRRNSIIKISESLSNKLNSCIEKKV